MKRDARNGRDGVLRGTPSTVATVATVAEWENGVVFCRPYLPRATLFYGSSKGYKGGHNLLHPSPKWSIPQKRSENAQPQNEILCSKGAWGRCPQQADGRKCECVLTLALLAGFVCGYPHALLAGFVCGYPHALLACI